MSTVALTAPASPPTLLQAPSSLFAGLNLLCLASDFGSSWLSIVASLTLSHPLDTLRVRRQTHLHSMLDSLRLHGPRTAYHGFLTPVFTTGPVIGASMALNDSVKRVICQRRYGDATARSKLTTAELALAGGAAGVVVSVLQCPIAVARITQQTAVARGASKENFVATLRSVFARRGVRGLYRGLPMEATQAGIGRLTYFTVYEKAKQQLKARSPESVPMLAQWFVAAVCASWCGWIVVYPCDVIKSRVQGDCVESPRFRGVVHAARMTYRELGFRGLWLGLSATLARGVASSGIALPTYDLLRPRLRTALGVTEAC